MLTTVENKGYIVPLSPGWHEHRPMDMLFEQEIKEKYEGVNAPTMTAYQRKLLSLKPTPFSDPLNLRETFDRPGLMKKENQLPTVLQDSSETCLSSRQQKANSLYPTPHGDPLGLYEVLGLEWVPEQANKENMDHHYKF